MISRKVPLDIGLQVGEGLEAIRIELAVLVQHLVQVEIRIRDLLPNQPGPDGIIIIKKSRFLAFLQNIKTEKIRE